MAEGNESEVLDLLGNGQLLKKVLRQGGDERPKPGELVLIHYEWRRASEGEGEMLESSRETRDALAFELGAQEVIPAWEHGVASMSVGELASFTVHPDLAYGDAGCGGGAVPSGATLRCDVELLEVSMTDAAQEELSAEERLLVAMRAKDAGNAHFKKGALQEAAKKYAAAITTLEEAGSDHQEQAFWQDEVQQEGRNKTLLACNLNLAQCELKLGNHTEAFKHAEAALQLEASNSKALYRRGVAAMNLGLFERSKLDLIEAARKDPKNGEIRTQLQECQRRSQASNSKDRSTFGGMFGKVSLYEEKAKTAAAPENDPPASAT